MTTYNINFKGNATAAPATWNDVSANDLVTNNTILDDTGTDNGVKLQITTLFTGKTGNTVWADSDLYSFPMEVWQNAFYASTTATTGAFDITGLPAGYNYSIDIIGHSNQAARDTDFTVEGTTVRYDNNADSASRAAPANFTGTVPVDGIISVSLAVVSTFSYINGLIVTVTPSGASITDIDTDDIVYPTQPNVKVNGSTFGAARGTGKVELTNAGATVVVDQSVGDTDWSDTQINIPAIVQGGLKYASDHLVKVTTDAAGSTDTLTFTLQPATDKAYVDVSSPISDSTSVLFGASPAVATGDQCEYDTATNLGNAVVVNADGTFIISGGGSSMQTFGIRVWDATDSSWSSTTLITVNGQTSRVQRTIARSILRSIMR